MALTEEQLIAKLKLANLIKIPEDFIRYSPAESNISNYISKTFENQASSKLIPKQLWSIYLLNVLPFGSKEYSLASEKVLEKYKHPEYLVIGFDDLKQHLIDKCANNVMEHLAIDLLSKFSWSSSSSSSSSIFDLNDIGALANNFGVIKLKFENMIANTSLKRDDRLVITYFLNSIPGEIKMRMLQMHPNHIYLTLDELFNHTYDAYSSHLQILLISKTINNATSSPTSSSSSTNSNDGNNSAPFDQQQIAAAASSSSSSSAYTNNHNHQQRKQFANQYNNNQFNTPVCQFFNPKNPFHSCRNGANCMNMHVFNNFNTNNNNNNNRYNNRNRGKYNNNNNKHNHNNQQPRA